MVKKVNNDTKDVEDEFLNILYGVILEQFNQKSHLFPQINIDKEKFLNDTDYRIEVLKTIIFSFEDGVHFIKSLLTTLYQSYFNDSKQFKEDYSNLDQIILKYYVAKNFLGDLIQYNQLDHELIPLKYILIAINYIMMKLKGLTEKEIIENLKKINIEITLAKLQNIMKEIIKEGIIKQKKKEGKTYYIADNELELSEAGTIKYNQTIRPLVEWFTHFWRKFYNIRELNVIVERNPPPSDDDRDNFPYPYI